MHLNPARAKLLSLEDRLVAYPWSSLIWYLAAPEHRPAWIRVDRLFGEHGIQQDTPAGEKRNDTPCQVDRGSTSDGQSKEPQTNLA